MSSSGGNIVYTVTVNDSGVTGKVGAINNSLKTVGTNAKTAATGTGSLNTSLNQVGTTSQTVATKTKGMSTAFSGFKSSISGMAGKGLALSLGIAGVASQIAGIADSYDNLRDTELTLQKQRDALTKSGNALTAMENRLAKMRKDGKGGTAEYALLEKKLKDGRAALKTKTDLMANAEDDYQRAQRAFYIQLVPQIIGIASQFASSILLMKTYSTGAAEGMKGMSVASRALGTAMKTIPLVAIAGAILAIRTNAFGFRDALEAVGVKIGQILPGLKPFLQWVHDMAAALGLTGGNLDMGKAFDLLKTGFQRALDTITQTNWAKVIGDIVNNIAHFLETADWKDIWKKFQDALFASGDWIYDRLNDVGKKIVDWFNAIKWDDVWNAFRSALFAGGTWVATHLKDIYDKIKTWVIGQDWIGAWQRFHDALFAGGEWLGTQLVNIIQWLKTNAPDKLKEAGTIITNATIAAVNSPEAKIAIGALDVWGAGAVTALGDSLVKALKSATAFLKGGTVSTQLQTNFETAGSAIDWIKVGGAWLKAALTNVGVWEWNTFGKTIMASFQTTFQIYAALTDFKSAAMSLLTNFGNSIGTALAGGIQSITDAGIALIQTLGKAIVSGAAALSKTATDVVNGIGNALGTALSKTPKSITDAGKALILELGKAIIAAVATLSKTATDVVNSVGNAIGTALKGGPRAIVDAGKALMLELGKAIVAAVNAGGKWVTDLVNGVYNAITKAPVKALTDAGAWIWKQIVAGVGDIGAKLAALITPQFGEAATPGAIPKQEVTPGVNNQIAMGQMTSILDWWKRIASDIQGIRPVLFIDSTAATALIDALLKVWQTKSTTMGAVKPALSADIKSATSMMDTVTKYWQSRAQTIAANVPKLTANNTSAFQIIDAVMKRWQSATKTISGMVPKLTVNNSQAINAINAVVKAMNNVKNVSRTITITTRYVTVGRPAAHNITGIQAHNITGAGQTTAVAPLIGGGNMTNNVIGGGQGDVNVTINMRDEFGIEKQRKFKAVLGRDRYVFGAVGSGG